MTTTANDGYIGILKITDRESLGSKKACLKVKIQIQAPRRNKSAREIVVLIGKCAREAGIDATIFTSMVVQINNVKNVVMKVMVQMKHNYCTPKILNDLLRKFAKILRDAEILAKPILGTVSKNNLRPKFA